MFSLYEEDMLKHIKQAFKNETKALTVSNNGTLYTRIDPFNVVIVILTNFIMTRKKKKKKRRRRNSDDDDV